MAHPPPAKVVLLLGPSGSGKTRLAHESGLPVVGLDDFYRDDTDPDLPYLADGSVDWDHPGSWDAAAAIDALELLCREGRVAVPDYRFDENRAVGSRTVDRDGSPCVVAEGIFAGELIDHLRQRDLLADALLIVENRWLTFVRRLVRDLREARKPPWYLVRQGWAKAMAEPAVVDRQRRQGGRPLTKDQVRARLRDLAADSPSDRSSLVGPVGIEPTTQGL